eukprot:7346659-Pyramimonas_sp.AAC.1
MSVSSPSCTNLGGESNRPVVEQLSKGLMSVSSPKSLLLTNHPPSKGYLQGISLGWEERQMF